MLLSYAARTPLYVNPKDLDDTHCIECGQDAELVSIKRRYLEYDHPKNNNVS